MSGTDKLFEKEFFKKSIIYNFILKYGLYCLAFAVILLNVRLAFDNVLWGDEAATANYIRNSWYGLFQIIYYTDNHPPLFYYWLKVLTMIFGYKVPVFHMAALIPFFICIIFAVTEFRREFGHLAAAFFVVFSGLASACVEYNQEVRMYSMVFMGITMSYFYGYKYLKYYKNSNLVLMFVFALVSAYSHYFGLAGAGILLFLVLLTSAIMRSGREWIKGGLVLGLYIICYIPWIAVFINQSKAVKTAWWMDKPENIVSIVAMVFGRKRMAAVIIPVIIFGLMFCIIKELGSLKKTGKSKHRIVDFVASLSLEVKYTVLGLVEVFATIAFGYVASMLINPILTTRYIYPFSGIIFVCFIIVISQIEKMTAEDNGIIQKSGYLKCALAVIFLVSLLIGTIDYTKYSNLCKTENLLTNITIDTIGTPSEEAVMVSNGIGHLSWSVLGYYYQSNSVAEGNCTAFDYNDMWYFSPGPISEEDTEVLKSRGYEIYEYGTGQISKYGFWLFHVVKE